MLTKKTWIFFGIFFGEIFFFAKKVCWGTTVTTVTTAHSLRWNDLLRDFLLLFERLHDFFCEEIAWFFVWKGYMTFCVKWFFSGKKSFLVKTVFWWKKVFWSLLSQLSLLSLPFCGEVAWFFCWEVAWGCLIFFVKRLRDFVR